MANGHLEASYDLQRLGRLAEALQLGRQGIAELTPLMERDPRNTDNRSELVGAYQSVASLLADSGDRAGARAALATASGLLDVLLNRPTPKRAWRLAYKGREDILRARLADSPAEAAEAKAALAAYLADIGRFELRGGQVPALNQAMVADAGLQLGDLLARSGDAAGAQRAWQEAAARLRPLAERLNPAAMTLLAHADFRLGSAKDAQAWADRVRGTSYRHPAYADLQQKLGQAQTSGETPRP